MWFFPHNICPSFLWYARMCNALISEAGARTNSWAVPPGPTYTFAESLRRAIFPVSSYASTRVCTLCVLCEFENARCISFLALRAFELVIHSLTVKRVEAIYVNVNYTLQKYNSHSRRSFWHRSRLRIESWRRWWTICGPLNLIGLGERDAFYGVFEFRDFWRRKFENGTWKGCNFLNWRKFHWER